MVINLNYPDTRLKITLGLTTLLTVCFEEAQRWWHDPITGERLNRNKGELIALMHSELSECLEGERKESMDSHLPHRPSPEVELADLIIRVADYAQAFNYDLAGAVLEKLDFNRTRLDHTYKARQEPGGKKF